MRLTFEGQGGQDYFQSVPDQQRNHNYPIREIHSMLEVVFSVLE
jgi:hypothetical protein